MKKKFVLASLLLCAALAPPAFSAPPDALLKEAIKTAPSRSRWPNSDYVKLLDLGTLTILPDGATVGVFRETYKLFDRNARSLAEVNLPFNNGSQTITLLSAHTIQPDGKILTVNPADTRLMGQAGDYRMYDDALALNFSMPGVTDGAIIDYTYRIVTHPTLPGQSSSYWGFNDIEPVLYSRYIVHVPADLKLPVKVYNAPGLSPVITLSQDGKTRTYFWEKRSSPPIPIEPAMPPISEVREWLQTSTIPSWQAIGSWYYKLQEPQAVPDEAIKQKTEQLTAGIQDRQARAAALYRWVSDKVRYVGIEFGISAYRPHPVADVYRNLYGDCKDKATLLAAMLRLAGIPAEPALLHAGSSLPLTDELPDLNAFDHCIVLAHPDGKNVWLDTTADDCPYGQLPTDDQGAQALVAEPHGGTLQTIPLDLPEADGLDFTTTLTLQPDGSAATTSSAILTGSTARQMRSESRSIPLDRRRVMMEEIAHRIGLKGSLITFHLPSPEEAESSLALTFALKSDQFGKTLGNLLLIPLESGIRGGVQSNPYPDHARVWPLVQPTPSHLSDRVSIHIPPGYTVSQLPADLDLKGPLEEYTRTLKLSADGKSILLTDLFTQRTGTAPASSYPQERKFWEDLLKDADDPILLQKGK